jgi:NADAR domain
MAVSAADVRTVDQLLRVIRDGGQPKYLLFWGHQPPPAGGASPQDRVWGIGLVADDERAGSPERWLGLNLLGFALMEVRHQLHT